MGVLIHEFLYDAHRARKKLKSGVLTLSDTAVFRLDKIPCFLQKYAATVLSTGKYLNVIQQCDKSAQWAALQSLEYLPNSEHYHPIIEKVACVYLIVLNRTICIILNSSFFDCCSIIILAWH